MSNHLLARIGAWASAVCVLALAASGCSKHSNNTSPETVTPATNSAPTNAATNGTAANVPPQMPPGPPPHYITANAVNTPQQTVTGQTDPFLTQQLRIYVRQYGRLPQSFSQFAAARLDSLPVAPPGTKWVIDATHMEVKAAPAK